MPHAQQFNPVLRNHVTVSGRADAHATMLFVHGFGTDQTAWKDVIPAFENRYRVLSFDHVGMGRSLAEAYSQHRYLDLGAYADDLLEICDALRLLGVTLVGHSVGAMAGALAAIKQPHRFSRLILIGASPRYLDDPGYRGGFTKVGLDELYRAMMANYSGWADAFAPMVMANPDRPSLAQHFAAELKSIPADRALSILCTIFQSDHRADVAKLTQPTLLIHGRDDPAVPVEVAHYLKRTIEHSRLRFVDAQGHLPHVAAPAQVVEAMLEFLDEISSEPVSGR